MNMQKLALNLLANSPNVQRKAQQNPALRQGLAAIQNGDNVSGENIARNLCASMGVTPEQATEQAQNFFRSMR